MNNLFFPMSLFVIMLEGRVLMSEFTQDSHTGNPVYGIHKLSLV